MELVRSAVIYALVFLQFDNINHTSIEKDCKKPWQNIESLTVAQNVSSVCFKSNVQRPTKLSKFNTTTAPFTCKLSMAIRLMKYTLAVNLVLLSNDVETQRGPIYQTPNLNCSNVSYSSSVSSGSASSPCSNDDGSGYTDPYPHFDIGLPATGLRIGHWNVNHLTSTKFDQIKLYLSKKDGKAQVDVMFLTETFLKSDVSDSLYDVEGFTLLRKDRTQKHGGGILAYVSTQLKVKRDLIWNNLTWKYFGLRYVRLNRIRPCLLLEFIALLLTLKTLILNWRKTLRPPSLK